MKLKPIEDMEFIIQTVDDKVVNDFAFELLQSFEFLKWRNNEFVYYILRDEVPTHIINVDKYVPIGTVEFVREFQQTYYPNAEEALIPLNVPVPLQPFTSRWIVNVNDKSDMSIFDHDFDMGRCAEKELFRKSLTTIKDPSNGLFKYDGTNFEDFKGYQVSEKISIDSEWRVFIFKNKIQHIANYSGDCMIFPDAEIVQKMVDTYASEAPVAYTLDVGVRGSSTFVIECHRFFSCGLYGFNDYSILPYMFSQEWFEMKNINKIKK